MRKMFLALKKIFWYHVDDAQEYKDSKKLVEQVFSHTMDTAIKATKNRVIINQKIDRITRGVRVEEIMNEVQH